MARTQRIEVKGLRELGEKMRALEAEVAQKLAHKAVSSAAKLVADSAKTKAPVKTGNLQRNIITKRLPKSQTDLTSEYIVTVRRRRTKKQKQAGIESAFYGQFLEFGTVTLSPRPFLRPALDENVSAAIQEMKRALADGLAKAA